MSFFLPFYSSFTSLHSPYFKSFILLNSILISMSKNVYVSSFASNVYVSSFASTMCASKKKKHRNPDVSSESRCKGKAKKISHQRVSWQENIYRKVRNIYRKVIIRNYREAAQKASFQASRYSNTLGTYLVISSFGSLLPFATTSSINTEHSSSPRFREMDQDISIQHYLHFFHSQSYS